MPADDFKGLREALAAGPTPGPWSASNRGAYSAGGEDEGSVYGPDGEDIGAEFVKPIGDAPTIRGEMWMRDARYVAEANPVVIAALLAELDRTRAERDALREDRWISVEDRVPAVGQEVLVFGKSPWESAPSVKVDMWDEIHEAPVSFSSATICVGEGWTRALHDSHLSRVRRPAFCGLRSDVDNAA